MALPEKPERANWVKYGNQHIINLIAGVIAIGLLTLTAIMVMVVLFVPLPAENETLVGQAFGTVLSLLGMVVAFFYGTSTGNKQDRDTINTLAETAKAVQNTASPPKGKEVKLDPGEQVSVEAKDE